MAVNIHLPYPIHKNNKISYYSFSLNTKVKNTVDINGFSKKLKIEYPGINTFPLRLNINRFIYVSSQKQIRNNTPQPKITIPKGLSINQRMIRIIYECSGLTKGNSLVWDTYFAKEARHSSNSSEYIKTFLIEKYVSDNTDEQNRQKLVSTYLQLLTDLWSFLARVSSSSRVHDAERDNDWFFQSLRRSMIKSRNEPEEFENKFVIGELVLRKTSAFVPHQLSNLIQYLGELTDEDDNNFNIKTTDWSKATGGIPLNVARKIHYHLIGLCYSRINSNFPFNNEQETFRYVAWIRRKTSDQILSGIPDNLKEDLRLKYKNYNIPFDCASVHRHSQSKHNSSSSSNNNNNSRRRRYRQSRDSISLTNFPIDSSDDDETTSSSNSEDNNYNDDDKIIKLYCKEIPKKQRKKHGDDEERPNTSKKANKKVRFSVGEEEGEGEEGDNSDADADDEG